MAGHWDVYDVTDEAKLERARLIAGIQDRLAPPPRDESLYTMTRSDYRATQDRIVELQSQLMTASIELGRAKDALEEAREALIAATTPKPVTTISHASRSLSAAIERHDNASTAMGLPLHDRY